MEHRYFTNCSLVNSMMIRYIALSLVYIGACTIWFQLTWRHYRGTAVDKSLQGALFAIPILKLLQVVNYAAFTGSCPWQNQIQAKYLVMAIVTLSTIY